jgi:hypothetical protein
MRREARVVSTASTRRERGNPYRACVRGGEGVRGCSSDSSGPSAKQPRPADRAAVSRDARSATRTSPQDPRSVHFKSQASRSTAGRTRRSPPPLQLRHESDVCALARCTRHTRRRPLRLRPRRRRTRSTGTTPTDGGGALPQTPPFNRLEGSPRAPATTARRCDSFRRRSPSRSRAPSDRHAVPCRRLRRCASRPACIGVLSERPALRG